MDIIIALTGRDRKQSNKTAHANSRYMRIALETTLHAMNLM